MRFRNLLALFAAVALFFAACGGDDDDSGDDDTKAETSEEGAALEDEDVADPDTDADTDEDEDEIPSIDIPDDVDLGECGIFLEIFEGMDAESMTSLFSGDGMTQLGEAFENAADNAPSEIEDHLRTMADAYKQAGDALGDIDVDFSDPTTFQDPEKLAQLEEATTGLNSAELAEAQDALAAWAEDACPDLADMVEVPGVP